MVKRSKNSYIEILEFCKKIYYEKFQTELNIPVFHCDAEIGFINAAKFVFPDIEILLCSVHLIRTFQKNFIKKVSGDFYSNPQLLYIWKVLCGSIFLNLKSVEIKAELRLFFSNEKNKLEENLQNLFQNFVDYLNKYFLNQNAIFSPENFDFFDAIVMQGYCTTSTNCLESIDKQLKSSAGAGLLTLNSTCRVIKDFKVTYLKLHERCIVKGKLNRKRPSPMQREQNLSEILTNFSDLDKEAQIQNVVKTCHTIGNLTKTIKTSNILNRQTNIFPVVSADSDTDDSDSENSDSESF